MESYILLCQTKGSSHNFNETLPLDLKPSSILLPFDVDSVVMREFAESPSTLCMNSVTHLHWKKSRSMPIGVTYVRSGVRLFNFTGLSQTLEMVRNAILIIQAKTNVTFSPPGPAHVQCEHMSDVVQPYALCSSELVLGLELGPLINI